MIFTAECYPKEYYLQYDDKDLFVKQSLNHKNIRFSHLQKQTMGLLITLEKYHPKIQGMYCIGCPIVR